MDCMTIEEIGAVRDVSIAYVALQNVDIRMLCFVRNVYDHELKRFEEFPYPFSSFKVFLVYKHPLELKI